MSRRDLIRMSDGEVRDFLAGRHVLNVATIGPGGRIHLVAMWYGFLDSDGGALAFWTYAKSQKVKNLERDPRATLLVETGEAYVELRGIQIEAEAEIIRDPERVLGFGKDLTIRYSDGIDSIEGDAAEAMRAQAAKRVAIRFAPKRVATWDHRKLGGTY